MRRVRKQPFYLSVDFAFLVLGLKVCTSPHLAREQPLITKGKKGKQTTESKNPESPSNIHPRFILFVCVLCVSVYAGALRGQKRDWIPQS